MRWNGREKKTLENTRNYQIKFCRQTKIISNSHLPNWKFRVGFFRHPALTTEFHKMIGDFFPKIHGYFDKQYFFQLTLNVAKNLTLAASVFASS